MDCVARWQRPSIAPKWWWLGGSWHSFTNFHTEISTEIWLVVWNIWIIFPFHIWDVILPIDELICFKMVETTNLLSTIMNYIISIIINHEINSILTIYKPSSITGKTQPCSIWPFLQASKRSDLARSTSDGAYAVYAPWLVGGFDWQRSPLVVGKNWSWPWVKTIVNGHWMG
jgi:hypothetical protein